VAVHTAPFLRGLGPDRCPGALALHQAADGFLARVRIPGGRVDAMALAGLGGVAAELADGRLELTSRGNVQLRGIAAHHRSEFAERIADLQLLPSPRHEKVRNIVASPLAEIDSPRAGFRSADDVVADLDAQLCARDALAELPGRFLFGLDDGRGDVLSLGVDVAIVASEKADESALFPGGFQVHTDQATTGALVIAEAFLAYRSVSAPDAWRIAELPDVPAFIAVAARALERQGIEILGVRPGPLEVSDSPAGVIAQPDGRYAMALVVPLGRLTSAQAIVLAGFVTGRAARITPWRGVVIPDQVAASPLLRSAIEAGLGIDADSPWYGVSACIGSPGCANAHANVRADAMLSIERGHHVSSDPAHVRMHWSGCERRCGHPSAAYLDVLATPDGYVRTEAGGAAR
jgi:precorrin-3B synthase